MCVSVRVSCGRFVQLPGGGHSIVKNTGGWLDSLGSGWENIFWGSSKILIWTIVRG